MAKTEYEPPRVITPNDPYLAAYCEYGTYFYTWCTYGYGEWGSGSWELKFTGLIFYFFLSSLIRSNYKSYTKV